MTNEERLEKLERQNRRLLAIAVITFCLSAAAITAVLTRTPRVWDPEGSVAWAETIRAHEIQLVDAQNRCRVAVFSADGNAGISLLDEHGRVRAAMAITEEFGPGFGMADSTGWQRLYMGVDPDSRPNPGPRIQTFDAERKLIWSAKPKP